MAVLSFSRRAQVSSTGTSSTLKTRTPLACSLPRSAVTGLRPAPGFPRRTTGVITMVLTLNRRVWPPSATSLKAGYGLDNSTAMTMKPKTRYAVKLGSDARRYTQSQHAPHSTRRPI
jgi:hypothetical protein